MFGLYMRDKIPKSFSEISDCDALVFKHFFHVANGIEHINARSQHADAAANALKRGLMDCDIFLVGLNHRTASVDVRERFALVNHCDEEHWAVPCVGAVSESVILSTCNRVELLAAGNGDVAGQMLENWAVARGAKPEELKPYVYVHKNLEAVRHLFSVASSLDSMVLGEPQILGQLKTAYRKAVKCHATGVILNRLVHKAFSVAKRVRTETAVASSAVSISYAAVELAKRIFGDMRKRAGLARALALDPQILFLDEPSAGLDPVSSRLLDDLILELRDSLGTTFVIVSHELPSIFTIARNSIFLDAQSRTVTASGNPSELVKDPNTDQSAKLFLTRGGMRDRNEDAGECATAATSHAATSHKEQSR